MEESVIIDDETRRRIRPKSKRSKEERRSKKHELGYSSIGYDVQDDSAHNYGSANITESKAHRRGKNYVNEGFVDDAEIEPEYKEKVKKKREKNRHKHQEQEYSDGTYHNGHEENYMHDEKADRKPKKKTRRVKTPSPVRDLRVDDPHDDLREIERELELLGTTTVYECPSADNDTEARRHRKKKRKPRNNPEVALSGTTPADECASNYEQPNDTGYESFNSKKDKKNRKNKETNNVSLVSSRDVDQSVVVHYNSDQGDSPKVTRKKKRHKIRRKDMAVDENEKHGIDAGKCSPAMNSRVIKVHEKTPKKVTESDEDRNLVDEELQESFKANKLKKKKRSKSVEKLGKSFNKEPEDKSDEYDDINNFIDKIEEITLPKEKGKKRDKEVYEERIDDEQLDHVKKSSKKKSKGSKREMDDNSYIKTEVVPFSLESSSDSEHVGTQTVKYQAKVAKSHNFNKKQIVSESLDSDRQKRNKHDEEIVQHSIPKPVKCFAFDEESDSSSEGSDNASEEDSAKGTSEKEVEVKQPMKSHDKDSPKKSKKKGAKNYPKAVVAQSSIFEKDPESSPDIAHKPPRPGRKSQYDLSPSSSHSSLSAPLKGIFSIDGNSYDVVEKDDCMTWTCVSGASKVPKSRKKSFVRGMSSSGGSFRGSIASLGTAEIDELNTLYYQDILGVSIKKEKRSSKKGADSVCMGMVLYTYDKKECNRLKDRAILFQHPSEMECTMWIDMIKAKLKEFRQRPHSLKVFLQPWAGVIKNGVLTYNTKIKQIFNNADLETDDILVSHNEHIKQEVTHLELHAVDCVVAVGGDGTASRVITAVLNKSQEINGVEKRQHFTPIKPKVSFGIIPTGMTNHIAHSVMGVEDPVTAAIHIVLGTSRPVDVCSVFRDDKFSLWSFNGHYGYFGNVVTFLHRYAVFGEKKVDAAFMKALTKSKLRSYECDIQYIKGTSSERNSAMDGNVCSSECKRCNFDQDDSFGSAYSDEVHQLDQLNESQDSAGAMELRDKSRWTTMKGSFMNVSVFSIPGLSQLSPHGMSMFTHLADGFLDLAVVHSTDKKQFVRFLKRHGKEKNQFDFPFVETHRCREVRMQLRLKETWKHKDYDYDEIDYEVKKSEEHQLKRVDSMEVIDDLESDDSDDTVDVLDLEYSDEEDEEEIEAEISSKKKSKDDKSAKNKEKKKNKDKDESNNNGAEKKRRFSFFAKKKKDKKDKENESDDDGDENNDVMDFGQSDSDLDEAKAGSKPNKRTDQFVHVLELESSDEDVEEVENTNSKKKDKKELSKRKRFEKMFYVTGATPPDQRKPYEPPDYLKMDREYREKQQRKKDNKKKAKAERKMKSFWNIDNELQPEGCYHFRIHQGLVRIHGAGVSVDTEPDEVTMKCLSVV